MQAEREEAQAGRQWGKDRQRVVAQAGRQEGTGSQRERGGTGSQREGVQAVREENPDRQMKAHKPEKRGNDKQGG